MMASLPPIGGFNKSSETGPDPFAPSIFISGCQLRCPYCMNSRLVTGSSTPMISIDEVKKFVKDNGCKWIHISGGEPLFRPMMEILALLNEIKKWGCNISLSTNGLEHGKLKKILPSLGYVTMDIKTDEARYSDLLAMRNHFPQQIFPYTSLLALRERKAQDSTFNYEVRTTLYPPLVNASTIRDIGEQLTKSEKWVFQLFRKTKTMLSSKANNVREYTGLEVERMLNVAKEYSNEVSLREV